MLLLTYRYTTVFLGDGQLLQDNLDSILEWSRKWRVKFNTTKFALVRFSTSASVNIFDFIADCGGYTRMSDPQRSGNFDSKGFVLE